MEKEFCRPIRLAEYCYAYTGWRLLDFLLDTIAFYVLFTIGLTIYCIINPSAANNTIFDKPGTSSLVYIGLFSLYYFLFESFFQGKTIGKMILGLKVVDIDGNKPGIVNIALRTVCRLIPIDWVSFFGTDKWSAEEDLDGYWHDSVSKTYVIRKKKIAEYKKLQETGENQIKIKFEVPDDNKGEVVEGVFKPGDKVIYPPVNRIMYVDTVFPDGSVDCFQIDGKGKKEPQGKYKPNQIKHYTE